MCTCTGSARRRTGGRAQVAAKAGSGDDLSGLLISPVCSFPLLFCVDTFYSTWPLHLMLMIVLVVAGECTNNGIGVHSVRHIIACPR